MLYHNSKKVEKRAAEAARGGGSLVAQLASVRQVLIEVAMLRITWK